MARESCFFCWPDDEGGAAATAGSVDERSSIPPARALSLDVRPRRV